MRKLLLILAGLLLFLPSVANADECDAGTTKSVLVGAAAQQVVTNTTQVRICKYTYKCEGACTFEFRKHAGGTITYLDSLGAAGRLSETLSDVSDGGHKGHKLSTKGLYYDPATASTSSGVIWYVTE